VNSVALNVDLERMRGDGAGGEDGGPCPCSPFRPVDIAHRGHRWRSAWQRPRVGSGQVLMSQFLLCLG